MFVSNRENRFLGTGPRVTVRGETRSRLPATIYKICDTALWGEAERAGVFAGAPVDHADGYIHFSTAGQVAETAVRHFAGQADLVLVAVDAVALGTALRHEPSRGGALFPHLYGTLPLSAVRWVKPLPLNPGGRHVFPELHP
ncbi:MAG: hypothetical protein QOH67_420 [Hyphomicrobiales bacterium]|nr:hypothetical protein [Hyphomicrobiales bacterium]